MQKAKLLSSGKGRYVAALLIAAVFLGALWLCLPLRFEGNDDATIIYTLAGYRTGEPFPLACFFNVIPGTLIAALYRLNGAVPWFTVLQLVYIFTACVLVVKSLLKLLRAVPLWVSIAVFGLIFSTLWCFYSVIIAYTVSAAMLGSAACVLMLCMWRGESRPERGADWALIVLCLWGAWLMRQATGIICVLSFALSCAIRLGEIILLKDAGGGAGNGKRAAGMCAAVFLLCAVLCVGSSALNTRCTEAYGGIYPDFTQARGKYIDYPSVSYGQAPEFFDGLGWNDTLYKLSRVRFYLDPRVTTETLETINAYNKSLREEMPLTQRIMDALALARGRVNYNTLRVFAALALFALASLAAGGEKRRRRYLQLCVLGCVLLVYAACFLSAFMGRMPQRACYVAALTMGVMAVFLLAALLAPGLAPGRLTGRGLILLVAAGLIVLGGFQLGDAKKIVYSEVRTEGPLERRAMDRYALDHPDKLYVYTSSCTKITGPWDTWPDEKPTNILQIGSYTMYSPVYCSQLRVNGVDEITMDMAIDGPLYIMCLSPFDGDRQALLLHAYMRENYGEDVTPKRVAVLEGDVDVFQYTRECK